MIDVETTRTLLVTQKLLSVPARPSWMPSVQIRVSARSVPDAWRDYVYWTAEIDHDGGGPD